MPIKTRALGDFYPLKTHVFPESPVIVQNIARMTIFEILALPGFGFHVL
jgi:hypothetical protein